MDLCSAENDNYSCVTAKPPQNHSPLTEPYRKTHARSWFFPTTLVALARPLRESFPRYEGASAVDEPSILGLISTSDGCFPVSWSITFSSAEQLLHVQLYHALYTTEFKRRIERSALSLRDLIEQSLVRHSVFLFSFGCSFFLQSFYRLFF